MPTENLTQVLFSRWQQTLQPFNIDQVVANQVFTYLIEAYSSRDRYYHTIKHIADILTTIDTLQAYPQDLAAVQFAAWFHDVVYDTQAQDNEERSAECADALLTRLGIYSSKITVIKSLIIHTKTHEAVPNDLNSRVLLDADLAILAVNPVQYQEYAKAIRQEYSWVSEIDYIKGRKQVLERFLRRRRIYFTPLMFEVCEQSAKDNLKAEIEILTDRLKLHLI